MELAEILDPQPFLCPWSRADFFDKMANDRMDVKIPIFAFLCLRIGRGVGDFKKVLGAVYDEGNMFLCPWTRARLRRPRSTACSRCSSARFYALGGGRGATTGRVDERRCHSVHRVSMPLESGGASRRHRAAADQRRVVVSMLLEPGEALRRRRQRTADVRPVSMPLVTGCWGLAGWTSGRGLSCFYALRVGARRCGVVKVRGKRLELGRAVLGEGRPRPPRDIIPGLRFEGESKKNGGGWFWWRRSRGLPGRRCRSIRRSG